MVLETGQPVHLAFMDGQLVIWLVVIAFMDGQLVIWLFQSFDALCCIALL